MLIAVVLIFLFFLCLKWEKHLNNANSVKEENQTPEAIDSLPKKPDFILSAAGTFVQFNKGNSDSVEGSRFKSALKDTGKLMQAQILAAEEKKAPPLDLDNISNSVLDKLDPDTTVPNYIFKTRISVPDRLLDVRLPEKFKEIMAYPEYDIPMYKPLIDKSADLFLPNINYISQNSISLLETNQPFIEAYMTGLNHEFARELLWREYPTDQRGSYFRQFWDVSDFAYEPSDIEKLEEIAVSKLSEDASDEEIEEMLEKEIRESLKDIPKIHLWSRYSDLGSHDHRENYKEAKLSEIPDNNSSENKNELVLVIRGELLKKYPNAVIYAHRARWQGKDDAPEEPVKAKERVLMEIPDDTETPPRDTVKTPLYEAKADPDIYFFGFDLTADTALGMTEGEPDDLEDRAGWFFIIKERPGEPRFGLDTGDSDTTDMKVWNDFSWGAVLPEDGGSGFIEISDGMSPVNISDTPPDQSENEKELQHYEDKQLSWANNSGSRINSSELAYILYQAPVMMAVHAAEML